MLTIIAMVLVIIGAINLFAVGVFDFNIINWIFTAEAYIGARIVYGLIGVAGLWLLIYLMINKFSPSKINAPESLRRQASKRIVHDDSTEREDCKN